MPLLEAIGLRAGYGKRTAIFDVSLSIEPGECVAVVGANGAGKSTLLKTISNVHERRGGAVTFLGQDTKRMSTAELVKSGLVLCPENRGLFPSLSVLENVVLGATVLKLSKDATIQALQRVYELFPILEQRPRQLAGTLSGGEQQMVALARAFMADPKLLVLDEPTLGLAPMLVTAMFATVQEIQARGCAVLIAEQNVRATLDASDRAYVMESGSVVTNGTCADLLQNHTLMRVFLGASDASEAITE